MKEIDRQNLSRMSRVLWFLVLVPLAAAGVFFSSCATVYTTSGSAFDVSGIFLQQKSNGYVLQIEATKQIGKVEAWIGQDNWLYITIPDTSLDIAQLHELEGSPLVAKAQFFRYESSVQVTLQLKEKFDQIEVLAYPDDNNIYVALYQFNSSP